MSTHNDYLDPDRHLPPEDYGFDSVLAAVKAHDTGRWRWDGIDAAWTGKDADLESWGNQGLKLLEVTETEAVAEVFLGKTFAGTDVCLNVPQRATNKRLDAAHELYLAYMVFPSGGTWNWDGDSWTVLVREEIRVPIAPNADASGVDPQATANVLLAAAEKALAPAEEEMAAADATHDVLAGWKRRKGETLVACPPGRPGPESVWAMTSK